MSQNSNINIWKRHIFKGICNCISNVRKSIFSYTFGHTNIINVWLKLFQKMGQKRAQNPAFRLYQKNKVMYMKVIISYELILCHKCTSYIACMLKHQVLMQKAGVNNEQYIPRAIFSWWKQFFAQSCTKRTHKIKHKIHSLGRNYFKNLMYTYDTSFWCKKVGVKYEQNIPMVAFLQIEMC